MEPRFKCPKCHAKMKADQELCGTQVDCPRCGEPVTVPSVSFQVDDVIGGFRLESWIGSGSMGEVYRARQLSMDRPVALKILRSDLADDAEHIERFSNEVRMLAKLDHPNIVTAFEAGRYGSHYFLAMSFVSGYNLDECMAERPKLPEKETLKVVLKVAKALDYAWSRFKILHRDIKPSNIMIDTEGEVKLTDMGISMKTDEANTLDEGGFAIGTPFYMSPEQASGREDLDFRADMFSLGSTLYHLVTGVPAFDGDTANEILLKVIHDPCKDASEVDPELSDGCCRVLRRMMAKDRKDRYDSWDELIADLQTLIRGEEPPPPVPVATVVPEEETPEAAKKRHKRRIANVPPPATLAPPPSPKRNSWLLPAVAATIGFVLIGVVVWQLMSQNHPVAPPTPPTPPTPETPPTPTPVAAGNTEPVTPPPPSPEATRLAALEKQFQAARKFAADHAGQYDEAIARFEALKKKGVRTKYALMAEDEISRIYQARQQAVEATKQRLEKEADKLADKGALSEAARLLRTYKGDFAEDTKGFRTQKANEYTNQLHARQNKQRKQQREIERAYVEVLDAAAACLVKVNYGGAVEALAAGRQDPRLVSRKAELDKVSALVGSIHSWQDKVLESFQKQAGQEVTVALKRGREKLQIREVTGGKIKGFRLVESGRIGLTLSMADLSFEEVVGRLARIEDDPSIPIVLGLLFLRADKPNEALTHFSAVGGAFGASLTRQLHAEYPEPVEDAAWAALSKELESLPVTVKRDTPVESVVPMLQRLELSEEQRQELATFANSFRDQYGYTALAARWDKPLRVLAGETVTLWPLDASSLGFAWLCEDGGASNRVFDPTLAEWVTCRVKGRGGAFIRPKSTVMATPADGMFVADEAGERLLAVCQTGQALSIEAVVAPAGGTQKPGALIAFGNERELNFLLEQVENDVRIRIRTSATQPGMEPAILLLDTSRFPSPLHLVVSYAPGQLLCFANGVQVVKTDYLKGDLSTWTPQHLTFANTFQGENPWHGELSRIGIYGRAIDADEAKRLYFLYSQQQ